MEETCRIIKPYVNQNSNVNGLERALSTFLSPRKPAAFLSKILIQACKVEKVSYGGIEQIAKDNTEDILLNTSNGGYYLQQGQLEALWNGRMHCYYLSREKCIRCLT